MEKELKYELIEEKGPEHNKIFVSDAMIDGQATARGEGSNRKNSEQMAAYKTLLQLRKKAGLIYVFKEYRGKWLQVICKQDSIQIQSRNNLYRWT